MIRSVITATGAGLPERIVKNEELFAMLGVDDAWIYKRSGIHERRIAVDENTSGLAIRAAEDTLKKAGKTAEEIDMILTSTCTPDYQTPNLANQVQKGIGAKNAVCLSISAACSGFIFAMSVADKYIKTGTVKNVLLVSAEILSKATDWSDKGTCILFGDGAAAVLLERRDTDKGGILSEELGSRGDKAEVLTHGYFPAASAFNDTPPMEAKDNYIFMDGLEVFSFATKRLTASIKAVAEKEGIALDDIKYIVPHQANSRIIDFVAKKLEQPIEKFYLNLERFGNTSSASIPIALNEMNEKGLLSAGDRIMLSGFGGGLAWGTMLIEWV
ncbi:MAG: ketoacyl-ACP synthase III [Lachnospiraceae bacterium]|nr:ketoacyl-ACP synthase III [Lachnospiraceae bacterium]